MVIPTVLRLITQLVQQPSDTNERWLHIPAPTCVMKVWPMFHYTHSNPLCFKQRDTTNKIIKCFTITMHRTLHCSWKPETLTQKISNINSDTITARSTWTTYNFTHGQQRQRLSKSKFTPNQCFPTPAQPGNPWQEPGMCDAERRPKTSATSSRVEQWLKLTMQRTTHSNNSPQVMFNIIPTGRDH